MCICHKSTKQETSTKAPHTFARTYMQNVPGKSNQSPTAILLGTNTYTIIYNNFFYGTAEHSLLISLSCYDRELY